MKDLREHSFFALLDAVSAKHLVQHAETIRLKEGAVLFREGDEADSLYLVLNGSIRLTKKDPAGHEQVLTFVHADDFFGEFGVLDGLPRSAGAIVAEPGTVLGRISKELFETVFETSGNRNVLKLALQIIRKVRDTNELYVEERLRKERMTLVGEMAGHILHDLRNPFAVIQMVVYMLRRKAPLPAVEEFCDIIDAQRIRMLNMVDEILEFCKGETELSLAPVNVADLFAQAERLYHVYESQGIRITVHPIDAVVEGDENKLSRVLQNLIGNATDAFRGQPGEIDVRAETKNGRLLILVADNGPGIPPEIRAALFEPFATAGKKKGIGLGMAIARSIVEAHGGRLDLVSEPGHGATFTIDLPLKK